VDTKPVETNTEELWYAGTGICGKENGEYITRQMSTNKQARHEIYCFRWKESSRDDECDKSLSKATTVNTIAPCRRGREV